MKNKILVIGLILMLGAMLVLLTGCGEQQTIQTMISDEKTVEKATEAKRMNDIGAAKDSVQIEVSNLLNKYYEESALGTGKLSNTAKEYIIDNFKNGKTTNGYYIIVRNDKVVVYENSSMQNKFAEATLDDNGKLTWDK